MSLSQTLCDIRQNIDLGLERIDAVHAFMKDLQEGVYISRTEHNQRVNQLLEANNEMVEETRALRRQLLAAGIEPCV